MSTAIRIENLRKAYGSVVAVEDVSVEVGAGEIFGVVGPNGAGKTTTIECIEGIRRADSGQLSVLGCDPSREERELRQRIGVQLQQSALPPRIKVWEALDLYSSFYDHVVDWRVLLTQLGLADKADAAFANLSGGQKQRLFIALAMLNDPELIFLDELTTGLDPQARRAIWELVESIRENAKTVVLTTHFMEEAEHLCDRVAIMNQGRIVALDTPANLIRNHGSENRITFTADDHWESRLRGLTSVVRVDREGERVVVHVKGDGSIGEVVAVLSREGFPFRDLRTEQSTLEDVFLTLTGREIRD
jgi:ABC-2 type transport system ATP-binding protein